MTLAMCRITVAFTSYFQSTSTEITIHASGVNLGRTHLGRTHLGRTHLGRTHLGRTHLGRTHLGRTHLGRTQVKQKLCTGHVKSIESLSEADIHEIA